VFLYTSNWQITLLFYSCFKTRQTFVSHSRLLNRCYLKLLTKMSTKSLNGW
jgi:hypothetical protein